MSPAVLAYRGLDARPRSPARLARVAQRGRAGARMKTTPIVPARIVIDDDGTPRSAEYDDVYHPRSGALAQARHVFLDGDALAARWRGKRPLRRSSRPASASATTSSRPGRPGAPIRTAADQLHFISIEAVAADARRPSRRSSATRRSRRSRPSWRASGRRSPATCTASPSRAAASSCCSRSAPSTPGCRSWSPTSTPSSSTASRRRAIRRCGTRACSRRWHGWPRRRRRSRRGAPRAPFATACAAPASRSRTRPAAAASATSRAAASRRASRRDRRRAAADRDRRTSQEPGARVGAIGARRDGRRAAPVVIVGAGLAGCALARALAERGMRSLVVERGARGRRGRLGQCRRALPRRRPSPATAGTRAFIAPPPSPPALPCARRSLRHGVRGSAAGLLRLETAPRSRRDAAPARRATAARRLRRGARSRRGQPPRRRAAVVAGLALPGRGLGRSARPRPLLARRRRRRRSIAPRLRRGVAAAHRRRLAASRPGRRDDRDSAGRRPLQRRRRARGPRRPGRSAASAARSAPSPRASSRRSRRRACRSPAPATSFPRSTARVWFGASSAWDDADPALRRAGSAAATSTAWRRCSACPNRRRSIGSSAASVSAGRATIDCRSSAPCPPASRRAWRPASSAQRSPRFDQPRFVARAPGLFVCCALGSRGIASAALGAQVLAAAIAGAPLPAEADLLDAIDPARFLSSRLSP